MIIPQSLPSELKRHIAGISSRSSLAALALTHSAYRKEAEEALYHSLAIVSSDEISLMCIETLAVNSEKAGYVHVLTVECVRSRRDDNRRTMVYLLRGLINMDALADFRIRLRPDEVSEWVQGLNNTLCQHHFHLKTLYCNEDLDISKVIKSRSELQVLGIYANGRTENLLKSLEEFKSNDFPLPLIFTLERESFSPVFDHISIFPAFYSVDKIATYHRTLERSIDADKASDMRADVTKVSQFSIYLENFTNTAIIRTISENMASVFPRITWLNLHAQHRFDISLHDAKEVLAFFPNLTELNFFLWSGEDGGESAKVPRSVKVSYAKEWALACEELISVTFIDGEAIERESGEDDWV